MLLFISLVSLRVWLRLFSFHRDGQDVPVEVSIDDFDTVVISAQIFDFNLRLNKRIAFKVQLNTGRVRGEKEIVDLVDVQNRLRQCSIDQNLGRINTIAATLLKKQALSDLDAWLRESEDLASVRNAELAEHVRAHGPAHKVGVGEASDLTDLVHAAVVTAAASKLADENRCTYLVSIHRASSQPLDVVREAFVLVFCQFSSCVADVLACIATSLMEAEDLVRGKAVSIETDERVISEVVEPLKKAGARVGTDEVKRGRLGELDGAHVHSVVKLG